MASLPNIDLPCCAIVDPFTSEILIAVLPYLNFQELWRIESVSRKFQHHIVSACLTRKCIDFANVHCYPKYNRQFLSKLANYCPNIEKFSNLTSFHRRNGHFFYEFDQQDFEHFACFHNIKKVDLQSKADPACLVDLLLASPNLEDLDITYTPFFYTSRFDMLSTSVKLAVQNLVKLKRLHINQCYFPINFCGNTLKEFGYKLQVQHPHVYNWSEFFHSNPLLTTVSLICDLYSDIDFLNGLSQIAANLLKFELVVSWSLSADYNGHCFVTATWIISDLKKFKNLRFLKLEVITLDNESDYLLFDVIFDNMRLLVNLEIDLHCSEDQMTEAHIEKIVYLQHLEIFVLCVEYFASISLDTFALLPNLRELKFSSDLWMSRPALEFKTLLSFAPEISFNSLKCLNISTLIPDDKCCVSNLLKILGPHLESLHLNANCLDFFIPVIDEFCLNIKQLHLYGFTFNNEIVPNLEINSLFEALSHLRHLTYLKIGSNSLCNNDIFDRMKSYLMKATNLKTFYSSNDLLIHAVLNDDDIKCLKRQRNLAIAYCC